MIGLGYHDPVAPAVIRQNFNPALRAGAIVEATTFFDSPDVVAKISRGLGEAMIGITVDEIPQPRPAGRARLMTMASTACVKAQNRCGRC